jgi:pyrroline-5-carboxylate reductase
MLQDAKICFIGSGIMADGHDCLVDQQELVNPKISRPAIPIRPIRKLAAQFHASTTSNNRSGYGQRTSLCSIKPSHWERLARNCRVYPSPRPGVVDYCRASITKIEASTT